MNRRAFLVAALVLAGTSSRPLAATGDALEAMRHLVRALMNHDPDGIVALLSPRIDLVVHYDMTGQGGADTTYPFDVARDQLEGQGALFDDLIGRPTTGLDCFADYATTTGGRDWRQVGRARFVPPDEPDDSLAYIGFRLDEGRFVLAEIGWPVA